ncbi:hypothetical protein LWI28_018173 [Acer negundo]|uniref:Uncharacterized protein n=1 Tax=Acer negundo TaxID=4023 RepID=A0AAD5IN58_ACENE|nr:hypothetical protein LWI28_018173 [Acer negundo]
MASFLLVLIICHLSLLSWAEDVTGFNPKCPSLPCGILGNISFPFTSRRHPECGLLMVDDCSEPYPQKIQLGKDGPSFYITEIKQDNSLVLRDQVDPEHTDKCGLFQNFTLSSSPFYSFELPFKSTIRCNGTHYSNLWNFKLLCNDSNNSSIYYNQTTHDLTPTPAGCNESNNSTICYNQTTHDLPPTPARCNESYNSSIYYNQTNHDLPPTPAGCSVIQSQVTEIPKQVVFSNIYTGWFYFQVNVTEECYDCYWRGGQCQTDSNGNFKCTGTKTGSVQGRSIIQVAVAATSSGVGILIIILVLCFKKKNSFDNSMAFWKKKKMDYQNIEAFIRNYGSLAPKRYSYSQIKKMTSSFKVKLGQGGYGSVYKGMLHDGRDVAVKVLNESKEVCCREFGEVSYKSDVYSYGMMVLEMAGRRKNVDVGVGKTSEIYFPHWVYERLEVDEELGLQGIENEEDKESARKMIIVSLWCILTNPSSRPAMNRVVEMLEGSLDSLQIPPKPFLYSSRSQSQAPDSSASASASLIS